MNFSGADSELQNEPRVEHGDGGAVFRRRGCEMADRRQARGARHVLHDHARMARDVATEMARQEPRILVVAATGRIADDEAQGLAAEEGAVLRHRLLQRPRTCDRCQRDRENRTSSFHDPLLVVLFLNDKFAFRTGQSQPHLSRSHGARSICRIEIRHDEARAVTIEALLSPRSVAVLGASERASVGRGMVDALERIGFEGAIYPINPKYATVAGRNCYASLRELPEPPDVVSFCIRNDGVVEGMRAAAERGARAAVIYDGGFAEIGGDGEAMQTTITGICREAGIALCGPNCMGVLNPPARSTTFKQEVRDPQALIGNVALISQSGSVAASLLADLRRFGFSFVVSSGNEAVNDTASYIEFAIDDPNTKVIATLPRRSATPIATSRRSTARPTRASP